MPKFKVSLPFTERIIEADDADEACDRFRDDETIFYELEAEPVQELLYPPVPEIDPAVFEFLRVIDETTERLSGATAEFLQKKAAKAPQTP
jgi:hypothetical protein